VAYLHLDDRDAVSLVAYQRLSGAPPPERELLTVEEGGAFRLWRSIAPTVGRFAGVIPDAAGLAAEVSAAAGSPPPPPVTELPSGASVEVVHVGEAHARIEAGAVIPGPWGALLTTLRDLTGDLTDQPLAAVALVVDDPAAPRLEHRGSEALPVELDSAAVFVEVWHEGLQVAASRTGAASRGRVMAEPGWSVSFAVGDVAAPPGSRLTARASLVVDDEGIFVPVTVTHPVVQV
jgi:hypothetical protein